MRSILVLALMVNVTSARAQVDESSEDRRARELYLRGDRLYAEGNYDEAAKAFEESFALSRKPLLLFNMANAYERLGRLEEALAALRRYAPEAPEYERDTIVRRISSLDERIREQAARGGPSAGGGRAEPQKGFTKAQKVGFGFLGGAGAALGTGIVLAVLTRSAHKDAEDSCSGGICMESAESDLDRERSLSIVTDIVFGVAAAAAVTGVVLILTNKRHSGQADHAMLTAAPIPSGGVLTLKGKF